MVLLVAATVVAVGGCGKCELVAVVVDAATWLSGCLAVAVESIHHAESFTVFFLEDMLSAANFQF